MNKELLIRVRDHIAAEPRRLRMADWILREAEDTKYAGEFPACGTMACIAGWTVLLSDGMDVSDEVVVDLRAAALLELDAKQADRLFYRTYWPEPFSFSMSIKQSADNAIARINHFIATDGAE